MGQFGLPTTVNEVVLEEVRQANAEVRRLRRGITEILAGRGEFGNWREDLYELIAGTAAGCLRPEWDHHREDEQAARSR